MKDSYSDGIFNVGAKNGFLPSFDPIEKLSDTFSGVQAVIDQLPTLLQEAGRIEAAIEVMKNYEVEVGQEEAKPMLQALYRAYTFLCSAYLLSPSHFGKDAEGKYGVAHQRLPATIAVPLCAVAAKLDVQPFLDYHYSYSLCNYVKIDKEGDLHWENLKMACSFTGTSDEVGFIMNHVYIEEKSPQLLEGMWGCLGADASGEAVGAGLVQVLASMKEMNRRRQTMWKASNHKNYNNFRAFIMGIQGNTEIFGDGVVYEGTGDDSPRQYRGQTGAQDDIIPSVDIFTGIVKYYPDNMLTKYLLDLRQYRPKCVQAFFSDLETEAPTFVTKIKDTKDYENMIKLLAIVEQVYFFRNGHWQFVQKYIMMNTKYANATGGTPIISWIPNQIEAVLNYIHALVDAIGTNGDGNEMFVKIRDELPAKDALLTQQLEELKSIDYNVQRISEMNKKLNDETVQF